MDATWFDEARLGMFIHWDHASQRGWELSWPLVGGVFSLPACQSVGVEEYHALAASFDPQAWDPAAVARTARRAGMRYVVVTSRHHSGLAMFDSQVSTRTIMHTPCGRDLLRETVDAFRAEGLRIGLYYSLSDWGHPDYPAFTEEMKPYVFGHSPPLPTDEQADRYRAYLLAQLRELMTGYGQIDVIWFDGEWERPVAWWRTDEIERVVRTMQPQIMINNRLPGRGDFDTPEQFVPATDPGHRWESCLTMNDSWGWNRDDANYKSSRTIVHALCETAGRGGNLLLNVSPRGDGSIPPEQLERLEDLARWMTAHHTAIHATSAGLEPWQFYGPSTRRGDRIHLFLLARPYDSVTVRGLPVRRVERVTVLATGEELSFSTRTMIMDQLRADPNGEVTINVPETSLDPFATVLAVDIAPRSPDARHGGSS
ncbi:MAG: alpha-L-fucosidase [Ilumatobacteraceae bacterium]